ncbi:MAG TPA: hypothetical protein VIL81_06105 [Candidatus Limnocylindrales bacterium]
MSDHESHSEANSTFSTNGTDPSGIAVADEDGADGSAFLADLARAMQTTAAAEQARNAEGTEQRRQAHIDAIRAREALEAEDLRELAKEDVKGIDAWSDGEIKRIKLERERRIAARREQLQVRLEEHRSVVAREVDSVEAAIASYRADIELYFRRLESETDPVAIATLARTRPQFPALELIGPDEAATTSAYQAPAATESTDVQADQVATSEPAAEAPALEVAAAEVPAAEAPVESEPVSAYDDQPPTDSADEPVPDSPLVGVMDQETASATPGTDWDSGSDSVAAEAEATEATPEVATEETAPVGEGSETTEPSDGSPEPEPVGAVADARVVMPRSTGTGSWLRWPNSTADRSDQSR